MKDYTKAFKAFDIRAIWLDPIDNSFAYSLGQAIGKDLVSRKGNDARFLIGADARERNNSLIYWFIKGLEIAGIWNYIGMGLSVDSPEEQSQERGVCSSALFYHFAADKFDMGAMFTASHNPPEYAGMKIVDEKGHLIDSTVLKNLVEEREDISDLDIDMHDYQRIWEIAMTRDDNLRDSLYASEKTYRETLQKLFAPITKKMTIVVDFSNGGAISYERTFLDGLMHTSNITFIYINDAADSTFSAHLSDTTDPHDYEQLIETVLNEQADMGIMFDGDGDRLGMVDELGNIIFGDISGGIIATNILQTQSDKKNVIHDVFHSRLVTEAITAAGGTPIKSRVGHRFVKEIFQEKNAAFGGEISGHQFFNEIGGFESPMCALGHFLAQVQIHDTVSKTVAPLLTSYKPPLIKLSVQDREEALAKIEAYYTAKGYDIDHTDGIGVYAPDRWTVIRASQTEPILRLCIETKDKEAYDVILKEIKGLL